MTGPDLEKMHRWESSNPVRVTHSPNLSFRPNVVKCNIYFTNFPDAWETCHFWNIFKGYGNVVDVHIPVKRNAKGQRFGFIGFMNIDDINSLLVSLNQIWIGSFKLRFYLARGLRESVVLQKNLQPNSCFQKSFKNEISQHPKSYAEVVKGVNDYPKNSGVKDHPLNINVGVSSDSKLPNVEIKSGSNVANEFGRSFASNHVDISMDNGVLVIKINFQELLSVFSSDSEDSRSTTDRNKTSPDDLQNIERPLIVCTKAASFNPISFPTSNSMVRHCRKSIKPFNLPSGPLSLLNRSHTTPFSSSLLFGRKQLQITHCPHSMQSSSNQASPEVPNSILDRGKLCLESSDCSDLGSPCISVHTRSFDDFNMPCGVDYNINEVSGESEDYVALKLIDNNGLEGDSNEISGGQSPTASVNPVAEHIADNDNDLDDEAGVDFECVNSVKTKNLWKKKKRKNYKWSKKKIRSKVKVQVPSPPKLTVEDTGISDSIAKDEAIKTLEVAKLLGLTFFDKDELITNHLMDLELEEQVRHNCI